MIEPFAGSGAGFTPEVDVGDGGPATDAVIGLPRGLAIDLDGAVYIGDQQHRVRRVDPTTHVITTIAGNGTPGFSGDGGAARDALVNEPTKMACDGHGTLYFIDYGNHRIRRITPDGTITTIAGSGSAGFSGDGGPATQAQFDFQNSDFGDLALDPGKFLYLADTENKRLRRIDLAIGIITTIVGPVDENGDPTDSLNNVTIGPDGNIYYSTSGRVLEMSPTGERIATYGSRDTAGWSDDGTPITTARLSAGNGLAVDVAGNILFQQGDAVRRINIGSGLLDTVAGIYPAIIGENGPAIATTVSFFDHGGLAVLPNGELLIGDGGHERIRKV
ncbi:hypothetical protein L0Y59_03845, partial [Candidatus Uhrbacteria bacterium]|nr:hypothetical protein [Candidatus Uhrbacteria bacterium]